MVKMWNLQTQQSQQVAKHDAPIKHVKFLKDMNNMLITGSWDKTIRYWDLRSPSPVYQHQLPERVYAMDAVFPVLVVALAGPERKIQVRLHMSHRCGCCCCSVSKSGHIHNYWIARAGLQSWRPARL